MPIGGTIAQDEDGKLVGETCCEQCVYIFEKQRRVIKETGFSLDDVVKMNVWLVDESDLGDFDRAFEELFKGVGPTCTLVGAAWLVNNAKVEVEMELVREAEV